MDCHASTAGPGEAGVPGTPIAATNANCLQCHSSAIGTAPAIVLGTNHHSVGNCAACHLAEPFAVLPASGNPSYNSSTGLVTPGTGCLACHGPGGLATHNTITADGTGDNHHSNHGSCTTCHGTYGGAAPANAGKSLAADGSVFCLTCHSNSGPDAGHHAVAAVVTAGKNCMDCHAVNAGVPGSPLAATNALCMQCHNSAIGTASIIIPGTNHHGVGSQNCTTCHGASGGEAPTNAGTSLAADGNAFCLTCHTNSGPDAGHHAGAAVAAAGKNCMDCHAANAGAPLPMTTANCLQCHSSAIGTAPAIVLGTNHHSVGDCAACHLAEPFTVLPASGNPSYNSSTGLVTPGTGCLACHGPGGLATHNTITADGTGDNHHSNQGSCTTCHGAFGGAAPANAGKSLAADGSAFCLTCHTNSGTDPAHHAVPAVATAGKNCMDCHAANSGVPANPLPATNANCLQCHSSAIGATPAIVPGVNHHGVGSQTCVTCHGAEPFTLHSGTGTNCTECHTDKSIATLNHQIGYSVYPTSCLDCHAGPGVVPTSYVEACGGCHLEIGGVAERFSQIHISAPLPSFTWTSGDNNVINFDSSASVNCASRTWNFNGGSGGVVSAISTFNTYTSTAGVLVSLMCSNNSGSTASTSRMVYPRQSSLVTLPTLSVAGSYTITSGFTVDLTTAFPDNLIGSGSGTIRIQWGDGGITNLTRPTVTATHTYGRARKYKARVTVYDSGGGTYPRQTKSAVIPVVTYPMSMKGNIITAPTGSNLPGVVVTLQAWANSLNNWKTVKRAVTRADGVYTFLNVVPTNALSTHPTRGFDTSKGYRVMPTKKLTTTTSWSFTSTGAGGTPIAGGVLFTGVTDTTLGVNFTASRP